MCNLVKEDKIKNNKIIKQFNLFSSPEKEDSKTKLLKEKEIKEKDIQKTIINIKSKYGKNAILRGVNLEKGATTIERNKQVGGHRG